MDKVQKSQSLVWGGLSGIVGTTCYILVNALPLNQITIYVLGMTWPILSIIFIFFLYKYIAQDHQTAANQLSFVFACLGFTIVACMISVQLAVNWGIDEYIAKSPDKSEILVLMRRTVRLVDHGLDVAWDLFIGTSLIFLSVAIKGHAHFRLLWAIPAGLLGIMLIVLNVITFPWPPNTKGLFDIGPFIGIYIIAVGTRLLWIAKHKKHDLSEP